MALIQCPECNNQISDKAYCCPQCGYPVQDVQSAPRKKRSVSKRKRLPNGFGRITEIKGNLRHPWRASVTNGTDYLGRYTAKTVGYYSTYNDAYTALVEYHANPYDLDTNMNLSQLYEKWTDKYFENVTDAYKRSIQSAWLYCSSISHMNVSDVRSRHIRGCMENGYRIEYRGKNKGKKIYPSASTKERIKSMFNMMFDFALKFELVEQNYARTFDVDKSIMLQIQKDKKHHIAFSKDEMNILWSHQDDPYVDWILIQCYMGWRPQELAILRLDEINLDNWTMCAGMKTDAGKQRIVPVHDKIRHLVQRNYDFALSIGSEFLLNDTTSMKYRSNMTYDKYAHRFTKVMKQLHLNPEHRPHDPRKTFITKAKGYNMDEYALKRMIGHNIADITESVYTERSVKWLHAEMSKKLKKRRARRLVFLLCGKVIVLVAQY